MTVSVVIPVYNDTLSLGQLLQRLFALDLPGHSTIEAILVDDGSNAATWHCLKQLKTTHPEQSICLIRLSPNQGQQRATYCGLCHAKGDVMVTMDADLQHPPEAIPKLVAALASNNHDLVYGTAASGHPKALQLASRLFKWLLHQPGSAIDRQANAFRCITAKLWQKVLRHNSRPVVNVDALLLPLARHPAAIATAHHPRQKGASSYSLADRFALVTRTLFNSASFTRTLWWSSLMLGGTGVGLLLLSNNGQPIMPAALILAGLALACTIAGIKAHQRRRYPPLEECLAEVIE